MGSGEKITCDAVILTTGTFLRGKVFIGDVSYAAGRMGDDPSVKLAERIDDFGLQLGRLKTGTPPRLNKKTINWDILDEQPGDDDPVMFSFLNDKPVARQVACAILIRMNIRMMSFGITWINLQCMVATLMALVRDIVHRLRIKL